MHRLEDLKRLIKGEKFNIPVICIGNIYLGGTGKTPTAILIANELVKIGIYKVDINFHSEVKANISIKIDKTQAK